MSTHNNKWTVISKKSAPKKQLNRLKDYCVFNLTGVCNNQKCSRLHSDSKRLQNIAKNPMYIFDKEVQIEIEYSIKEKINPPKPLYFTTCTFCFRNLPCKNYEDGRKIKTVVPFNGKNTTLFICYPEMNKCNNKVPCGFHFDIELDEHNQYINIIRIISPLDEYNEISLENTDFPALGGTYTFPVIPENDDDKDDKDDKPSYAEMLKKPSPIIAEITIKKLTPQPSPLKPKVINYDSIDNESSDESSLDNLDMTPADHFDALVYEGGFGF